MKLENESKYLELRSKRTIYENIMLNLGIVNGENEFKRSPNSIFMSTDEGSRVWRKITPWVLKNSGCYVEVTDDELIEDIYYLIKSKIESINEEIEKL